MADRLGPVRVTSAGLVAPRRVLTATWIAFAAAVLCGIYLTVLAGPLILVVGVLSIAAGVLYTGGPRPYGYAGLGEIFVFCFFGLVAVNGAYFVQLERLDWLPFGLSVAVGLFSSAILVVNNVRDLETDRRAGKMTLAVRLGRDRTRSLFLAMVVVGFACLPITLTAVSGPWWALLGLLALPLAAKPVRAVMNRTDGPALLIDNAGRELAVVQIAGATGMSVIGSAGGQRDPSKRAPLGRVATTVAEPLGVPSPTRTGPVEIPTGFPQTPEGAVAQLAAIDVAVIQSMSVPATHEIYRSWSTGEADAADWVMTGNVTDFLTAAGQSGQTKETGLVVTAIPAAGQVKGTDGDDWVLACVLLELRARLVEEARVAYGHCEAMTWTGDRWLIDPTYPVSPAPSTWPGTDLAAQAGWRPWATDHDH